MVASRERERTINVYVGIGIFTLVCIHTARALPTSARSIGKRKKNRRQKIYSFFFVSLLVRFLLHVVSKFSIAEICVVGVFCIFSGVKKNY